MSILFKFSIILLTITFTTVNVNCLDRQAGARRINSDTGRGEFKSPCGTRDDVTKKVAECLKPMFELIEGRFSKVPSVDSDFVSHCDRFSTTEKCLRQVGKDCLSGLHKTAVGAFASSTGRFKKTDCKTEAMRATFKEPMKCVKEKGEEVARIYKEMTGMAQAIRDLPLTPEEKMLKICCLLKESDDRLINKFNGHCPKQTQRILDIVHSVTDDAKSTLCLNPKCQGALNSVSSAKYKPPQIFIEPIMQILLTISTE